MIVINQKGNDAVVFNKISIVKDFTSIDAMKLENLRIKLEANLSAYSLGSTENKERKIKDELKKYANTMTKVYKIVINDEYDYAIYTMEEQCIDEFNKCINSVENNITYRFSSDKSEVVQDD